MSTTKPPAIHIRALSAADATVMHAWRNDDRITDMLVGPKRFVSLETGVAWNQKAREEHEREPPALAISGRYGPANWCHRSQQCGPGQWHSFYRRKSVR
ncbi:MAG: hypothetical protein IPN85_12975 [Flavobacteriales bacterium]|nr:hypothetical protein [Flavobacteriales bacterium]